MGLFNWLFGKEEQKHKPTATRTIPVIQETSGCCSQEASHGGCGCSDTSDHNEESTVSKQARLETCCGRCPCRTEDAQHGEQCCFSCCCNQLDNIRQFTFKG